MTLAPLPLPTAASNPASLAALRRRLWDKPAGSLISVEGYRLRITDGPNAYMQIKDVFVRGIYRFAATRSDPLIIDGGSNMGISILGFKRDHPASRIIAFEPDPEICTLLKSNLQRNQADRSVTVITAGLGEADGTATFNADGSAGGRVEQTAPANTIRIERLSRHLCEPVDFLKLNIEGQELPVLRECAAAGVLANVRQMVIEYHGWAGGPQCLGDLLNLLDSQGFRYFIHDFDSETCSTTKPPFKHRPRANWFCLVHAQREAD
ncbi:MAG TPA: FkbM family methyltransferase [Tepidisphaeraceae bacterium]